MTQSLSYSTPPRIDRKALLRKWLDMAGPAIALVVIFILFVFLVPDWSENRPLWYQLTRFANFDNITNILRQSCMTTVASLGVIFIIIAGGIDLSAGSLAALTGVIVAVTLRAVHHTQAGPDGDPIKVLEVAVHPIAWPLLAALMAMVVGLFCGLINGTLITGLRVVPFIITLGTMMIFRGSAKYFADESNVINDSNWLWAIMGNLPDNMKWLIFPPAIWITLLLAVLMAVILNYSRFGRQIIAVGSNEQTARLCGIPVSRVKIQVYALGGFFVGLAGLFFYSRITQGSPTSADAFELDVIAACVIGGASLNGGKGSIFGALVGALILNVIARGCSQIHIPLFLQHSVPSIFKSSTGLPTYVQQIVTGVIIITAVVIDRLRQRRQA